MLRHDMSLKSEHNIMVDDTVHLSHTLLSHKSQTYGKFDTLLFWYIMRYYEKVKKWERPNIILLCHYICLEGEEE